MLPGLQVCVEGLAAQDIMFKDDSIGLFLTDCHSQHATQLLR